MPTRLSVNINKIALLRNSREGFAPNVLDFGRRIVDFGADGITVHPRADQRHIRPGDCRDVMTLAEKTEINFEGDIRTDFLDLVKECRPTQCTLVPVNPGEVTSNHGWDFSSWSFMLAPVIEQLKSQGIRTSVFVDAGPEQAEAAAKCGADRIEIYTEPFAEAQRNGVGLAEEMSKITATVAAARMHGIKVNAGHDLTLDNLGLLLDAAEGGIDEVSIGHHLIVRALEVGLEQTVGEYLEICRQSR